MLHSQNDQRIPEKGIITRYANLAGTVCGHMNLLYYSQSLLLQGIGSKLSETKGEKKNERYRESKPGTWISGSHLPPLFEGRCSPMLLET